PTRPRTIWARPGPKPLAKWWEGAAYFCETLGPTPLQGARIRKKPRRQVARAPRPECVRARDWRRRLGRRRRRGLRLLPSSRPKYAASLRCAEATAHCVDGLGLLGVAPRSTPARVGANPPPNPGRPPRRA